MGFNLEQDFEDALINTLIRDKGWKDGVLNYPTEKDLLDNWAKIIYENNRIIDRLGDYPLTNGEMAQIMEQITALRTPLKLNGFINGGTIQIIRDNEQDNHNFKKQISLDIFDRNTIASGKTHYQIARQPKFRAKNDIYPNRRGDFCLLINGMPVIHVELKRSGVPISEAQYQIQKYLHEGVFTGLFSLVQIFVTMNPEECTYFANPGSDDRFSKKFCFHWADNQNNPINDWNAIADRLLSIPMAHRLIGLYTIADQTDNALKVMRSYQYYAAEKIADRVTKMKWDDEKIHGGYVWHTTGSGKTMTSFKSAQLIANSKDADKVVFLMDRIELGTQSLREYRGFSDETDDVQSTENTEVLITKLKSGAVKDTLIVTSIQKMSRIKEADGVNTTDIDTINKKRIVFIVDECHRSVFGEMLSAIKFTFPNAVFIGFSGTPILEINKKKNSTTADVFGNELEGTRYTVADGMRDGNVLGFDSIPQPTYKDNDLRRAVALEKAKVSSEEEIADDEKKRNIYFHWMEEVPMGEQLDDDGDRLESIEGQLTEAQYDRDEHREAVVEDILENWNSQSHFGKFHAILATSSIPEAIKYYQLFKAQNTKLKITAVFDPSDNNSEGTIEKIDGIVEILTDYNNLYFNGSSAFRVSNYAAFKKDVCSRLAHKDPYLAIENDKTKCLDILIVVDQMLTGYDSKWLNTLYLDKYYKWSNIEMIIQAFSRTNRVFTDDKPHGIVRYYRRPYSMQNIIAYAFEQYSGANTLGVFVQKLRPNLENMNAVFNEISELFNNAGIPDFSRLPDNTADKQQFSKLFRNLNKFLEPAKVQGFVWDKLVYEFENNYTVVLQFDETIYNILLIRYKELRRGGTGGSEDEAYDIDSYLMSLSTDKIDSAYMDSRFKKYVKLTIDGTDEETRREILNELHKSFASLTQEQQKYANILLKDIQNKEIVIDDSKSIMDYINDYQNRAKKKLIHEISENLGISEQALYYFMELHVTEENINAFNRFEELVQKADISRAKFYFESIEHTTLPERKVWPKLRKKLKEFILNDGVEIEENE